ncbi:CHAD domain-containing protein [Pseudogemmobacter bohemicus]|uniref:CHAD domain-containing protein n=1 Tax=Pseudogemmobacter bohemicus TaxID=2250708 RepID=UPI001300362F|nr:CHAD domain-containing protein [Pseudogemmobacter bohemicus]
MAVPVLSPETSCEDALGQLIIGCCAVIDRQLAVFLETEDESGPHKARVALRRLTTALDAFAPILRRKQAGQVRSAAKRLFRALGEVRDADVFLASHSGDREGLERRTLEIRRKTRKALRDSKAVAFAPGLLKLYGSGEILKQNRRSQIVRGAPVRLLAGLVMDDAWRLAQSHGDDPAAMGEVARHDFRKDMKTLRYLAEFFQEFWPGEGWPLFRARMEELQDQLGLLNDLANARLKGRAGESPAEQAALKRAGQLWSGLRAMPPFWASPAAVPAEPGGED